MTAATDSIVGLGSPDAWRRGIALLTGAVRSRWISLSLIALLFTAVGCVAAALLPRTYAAEARLLVTKNVAMPILANPRRPVQMGTDVPLQAAVEVVLSRPSLESIVRSNDLIGRWMRDRPAAMRVKDGLVERIRGPVAGNDRIDALVELVQKRLTVSVINDVVSVHAAWTDPQSAVDLVNSAVDAFLHVRRQTDVEVIQDTYTLLEAKAGETRARVDASLTVVDGARRAAVPAPRRVTAVPTLPREVVTGASAAPSGVPQGQDDGLDALRARMLDARAKRTEIDKRHNEKVAGLEAQLAERRAVQTDRHPDVLAMRRALDELQGEPDTLRQAREEESRLLAEYVVRGGRTDAPAHAGADAAWSPASRAARGPATSATPSAAPVRADASSEAPQRSDEEEGAVVYARTLFKGSLDSYQDLVARLADVQIELETARATFDLRYAITQPARLPKRASAPNVPLIVIGAVMAGFLAGALNAVLSELRARSLLSPAALVRHITRGEESIAA